MPCEEGKGDRETGGKGERRLIPLYCRQSRFALVSPFSPVSLSGLQPTEKCSNSSSQNPTHQRADGEAEVVAIGLLGYAVGNYLGFAVGSLMRGILG